MSKPITTLLPPAHPVPVAANAPPLEAFTTIYDLYYAAILRYCIGKCRDRDTAHDLTQATFLRFWLYIQKKEKIAHSRAFLYRIAHNLFIDHIRRKRESSLDELLEAGFEPAMDPWQQTYDLLDSAKPMEELAKMLHPQKQALHCRFVLGLSPNEIAEMTGETSNTISVRIFRGLRHLRGRMDALNGAIAHKPKVLVPVLLRVHKK